LRLVGAAAAVVQVADINKGMFPYVYRSAISLLVIDFTVLEGRDCELVVKELAAVDFHNKKVSSNVFQTAYGWKELP